ncbi:DUF881 domain-containing protein [Myceligenerans salitolerans]|uniref:DUF881 domain-containing protein n=1 Tax=Myceligenerans salitolerans TaxID=1230528 RepID=A0ABS3IAX2_9MICO|nr:DUF881 domain-containing protein [Myceligenerans salitolerans]MBO0610176.1 DUF881 domain-containing protein [Myceligenerans salitolerans]
MNDGTRDPAPGSRRRPDASMTLLNEVMKRPLDPGYAAAAARRAERAAAGEDTEPRVPALVVAMFVAVGLGLVVTVAVVHLRAPQPAATQARSVLADQVAERSLQVESLTDRSVALAAEVDELENAGTLPSALRETNDLDKLANGTTAVSGPGLVVTLTDGGLADDESGQRVWDTDLQYVVNALWASGAEAIAVGGERLTAVSAIRSAGDAILVDLQPLNGPSYRVEAIGDPEKLEVEFARSTGPPFLQVLGTQGIESSVQSAEELRLPAGRPQTLRWAEAPGTDQNDQDDTAKDGA